MISSEFDLTSVEVPLGLRDSTGQTVSQREDKPTSSYVFLDREGSLASSDEEINPIFKHLWSGTQRRRELSSPNVPQEYETDLVTWSGATNETDLVTWNLKKKGKNRRELPSPNVPQDYETELDTWSGVTTVMIRNLPCRCTRAEVLDAVHDLGFSRECVFFHMPFRSGAKQNQGYAFVGFRDPEVCLSFRDAVTGYRLNSRKSSKTLSVMPAKVQWNQWSPEDMVVAVNDIPR
eukprot:TRINITY_DN6134_c0_g2_i1.p1 TRINITY_DN6134_c0_g2~~TRINITY_DN6134_c0_g2_i1.p1  ORF type:complete len:234 (+),score=27.18 TRINITY_DN6134_c0_g2_i1:44-745(+)